MASIILAHNNANFRNTFYEIFNSLGYKLTAALSHQEVLDTLNKERPEYIILDPTLDDIDIKVMIERINRVDSSIKLLFSPCEEESLDFICHILKLAIKKQSSNFTPSPKITEKASFKSSILVVDDEKEPGELLKSYLSRKGYSVDAALSGEEALEKIKTKKPNVVLLDIRMSGMDGMMALEAIKEIDKTIAVIMTSAAEDREIIKQAIELGANGYLVKPFNLEKLEAMILSNSL